MASRNELETTSLRGKVARRVFTAFLFAGLLVPQAFSFPRPGPQQQVGHPRFDNNQHLGTWLQRHNNLTLDQQQRALRTEPGFNQMNPETQQKLLDRLHQIDRMPPGQRQRTVDRIEAMEHLSPQMRQQVQMSVQQFHSLPPDRQLLVKKAFRDLREYPPEQRAAMMNTGRFAQQFNPQERGILRNILSVEPYQPMRVPPPGSGLEYGR